MGIWPLMLPPVLYVLMTLGLQSGHFDRRRAVFGFLLLWLIFCVILFAVFPNWRPDLFIFAVWLILLVGMTLFFVDNEEPSTSHAKGLWKHLGRPRQPTRQSSQTSQPLRPSPGR